jgi:hypothetical protein
MDPTRLRLGQLDGPDPGLARVAEALSVSDIT